VANAAERRGAAVFIDGDNVAYGGLDPAGLETLIAGLRQRYRSIAHLHCFFSMRGQSGPWKDAAERSGAAVTLARNLDMELTALITELALTGSVTSIVLVSGDRDLTTALRRPRERGLSTEIVAFRRGRGLRFSEDADRVLDIERILIVGESVVRRTAMGRAAEEETARDRETGISVAAVSDELIRFLAANPAAMYELPPRKFEELMAELYERQGFDVRLTQETRDGGVDLYVVSHGPSGPLLTLVDAKRHRRDRPVGVGLVRQHYGVVEAQRASAGVVATTSYFSQDAKAFQQTVGFRLGLIDYLELEAMLRGAM
jgi:hypothetical protein